MVRCLLERLRELGSLRGPGARDGKKPMAFPAWNSGLSPRPNATRRPKVPPGRWEAEEASSLDLFTESVWHKTCTYTVRTSSSVVSQLFPMMSTVSARFVKRVQCRPELLWWINCKFQSHDVLRKPHLYPRAHVGIQSVQSCRPISQPGWFTKLCAVTSAVRNARAEQGIAPKAATEAGPGI